MLFSVRLVRPLVLVAVLVVSALMRPPAAYAQQKQSPDSVVDEIVAVVDDDIILRSEVEGQYQAVLQRQRQQPGALPPRAQIWNQILQSQIDNQVMAVHARRDTTLNASEAQVQSALEQRIERLAQRAGGRAALEQAYGKTINELKADFEQPVRDQMLAQRIQQQRLNQVRITPSEVREWFSAIPQDSLPMVPANVQLSQIVRRPEATENAQRQAREVIDAIRDSALAGVPIEELARRYSDDSGSAPDGGKITESLSGLVPAFAAVVSRAPLGEISQVFETRFGYHIARVNNRSGNTVDFNHVLIEIDKSSAPGDDARAFLSTVRDSIVNQGAPFELMARRHSEEERSAQQGGRVTDPQNGETTLRLERLGRSWRNTLDTLDVDEISRPAEVRLLNGERAFHLLKITDRASRHRMSMDDDYARIKQYALQEKQQRVYQRWVHKLREDVYVDVRAQPGDLSASIE